MEPAHIPAAEAVDGPRGMSSPPPPARGRLGRLVDGRLRPDLVEGWTGEDLPDLHGQTWAITGATHGIGLEAARMAAAKGARLVLFARSPARAERLLASWDAAGRAIACDLSDPASVHAAASALDEPVDVLLDNAGTFSSRRRHTPDGHELMWATNFLGPFMLTNLIRPWLRGRIVVTGSEAHRWGRLDLSDPDYHARTFIGWLGYAQSKLADVVWAGELSRRLGSAGGPDVHVAHPGWAATNLQHHHDVLAARSGSWADAVTRRIAQSAEAGAWPLVYAATQPLDSLSTVGPSAGLRGHPVAEPLEGGVLDPQRGRDLWAYAAGVTGTDLDG